MIYKIWITFFMLYNASRIPKLPRMLAGEYEQIPPDVIDVMRRLGCRDPRGVQAAMRRYGVNTIDELVEILEYQKPKRNIGRRIWLAVGRIVGGVDKEPHRAEIMQQFGKKRRNRGIVEIQQRIRKAKEIFR